MLIPCLVRLEEVSGSLVDNDISKDWFIHFVYFFAGTHVGVLISFLAGTLVMML